MNNMNPTPTTTTAEEASSMNYITETIETLSGDVLTREEVEAITGNDRWSKGNTTDRRNRRNGMLRHWGDGTTCACVWCGHMLVDMGEAASGAGHPDHITVDHIVCHKDGGRYIMSNLVPACSTCNKKRGAIPFDIWAARMGKDADRLRATAAAYRKAGRKKA